VPQSTINTFPDFELYGYSPWREVQLYIDGMLAGVAWPFPIIFTGGVVPGLWRPIVGIDAFDLKEDEIDISPWLPILCDGNHHNFSIRITGLDDDGNGNAALSNTTRGYWLVTAKVFLWLDEKGHITTGNAPVVHAPAPLFSIEATVTKTSNGTNDTLQYQVTAERQLSFRSKLHLSDGKKEVSWRQSLSFSNAGNFSDDGNVQYTTQQTNGFDVSSNGYAKTYSYPLYAYSVFATFKDNISINADVQRGKTVKTLGSLVFPTGLESFPRAILNHDQYPQFQGALLSTTQNGTATYLANQTTSTSYGFGSTEQDFTFSGLEVDAGSYDPAVAATSELFHRYVKAVNNSVLVDNEVLLERSVVLPHPPNHSGHGGYALKGCPQDRHDGHDHAG
jgi:hypothetical protein